MHPGFLIFSYFIDSLSNKVGLNFKSANYNLGCLTVERHHIDTGGNLE